MSNYHHFIGLKQLIIYNHHEIVVNLLLNKFKNIDESIYNQIVLISARNTEIKQKMSMDIVDTIHASTISNKLTYDLSSLVDILSSHCNFEYLIQGEERDYFDDFTYSILGHIRDYSRNQNIYPYAPVILWKLLEKPSNTTWLIFDDYRKGLADLLKITFEKFIENNLIKQSIGEKYQSFSWLDRSELQISYEFAWLKDCSKISEQHLLLGLLCSNSNSIAAIENKFNINRKKLIEATLFFDRHITPDLEF